MRIAHVNVWKRDGEWAGWLVIGRKGRVLAQIPKEAGDLMESHRAAQALAADLNAGGARRERQLRKAGGGR